MTVCLLRCPKVTSFTPTFKLKEKSYQSYSCSCCTVTLTICRVNQQKAAWRLMSRLRPSVHGMQAPFVPFCCSALFKDLTSFPLPSLPWPLSAGEWQGWWCPLPKDREPVQLHVLHRSCSTDRRAHADSAGKQSYRRRSAGNCIYSLLHILKNK